VCLSFSSLLVYDALIEVRRWHNVVFLNILICLFLSTFFYLFNYPSRYTGDWVGDVQEGSGVRVSAKGWTYDGQWKGGKKSGRGTETDASGDKYAAWFWIEIWSCSFVGVWLCGAVCVWCEVEIRMCE
jgi:hypothetical protein